MPATCGKGGDEKDADYKKVSSGTTQHKEAINIEYDPTKVTFEKILEKYMHNIDPLDDDGQFADKGPQYRTAIFYHDETQKKAAEEFFAKLKESKTLDGDIQVEIIPYKNFFAAEEYHQGYYKKSAGSYNMYKYGSGRPSKLKKIWGDTGEEH